MSQHDKMIPLTSFLQEEMTLSIGDRMMNSIASLPAATRLRLLAFLHFVEEPWKLAGGVGFFCRGRSAPDPDGSATLRVQQALGSGGTTLRLLAFGTIMTRRMM